MSNVYMKGQKVTGSRRKSIQRIERLMAKTEFVHKKVVNKL